MIKPTQIIYSTYEGITQFLTNVNSINLSSLLPYTPILALFWPMVSLLIVSFVSASSWIFWIFVSLLFGILHFLYALYQFPMIGCDLAILSCLKTFATMRSRIGNYTTGKNKKRDWRNKLGEVKNYNEFINIEIEEPIPVATSKRKEDEVDGEVNYIEKLLLRFQGLFQNHPTNNMSVSNIKRAKSCAQFHHDTLDNSLIKSESSTSLAAGMQKNKEREMLVKEVEKELGKKGEMLLTTTARLREARLQSFSGSRNKKTFQKVQSPVVSIDGVDGIRNSNLTQTIAEEQNPIANNEQIHNNNGNENNDDPVSAILYLLQGIVKRNHLSVENILIDDGQSVMECGRHRLSSKARNVITGYLKEVAECLDCISEYGIPPVNSPSSLGGVEGYGYSSRQDELPYISSMNSYQDCLDPYSELLERINLVRKMKHNMGRSALMLSGGGAQAMYHLGALKALCESGLYDDIPVISGTSGGSIVAAMCAIKTSDELLKDACVPHVSTDFGLTGEMERQNIRWFPKMIDMGAYWLKHRLLVDSKEFKRCCDFYYGDITFMEAFQKTGKHVCITVSASREEDAGGSGAQRLLLNHISTPHVTISSAVAASCALPGVMAAAKLVTKNSAGKHDLFQVDGVEWIDGSVQADLPFKRISTLFNVSNYIVCQTNFHVLPFLHKPHHPNPKSIYWRTFQNIEWDMRNRALSLSRFGLFPKIFGHDISKVFKQKYHGNLTLVPRFTKRQVFGLGALANPTLKDMERYLQHGQAATWPYLSVIKELLRLETSIDKCISRLTERIRQESPDADFQNLNNDLVTDAADASASYDKLAFVFSAHREAELLKEKVLALEIENMKLKRQMEQMSKGVGISVQVTTSSLTKSPSQIEFVSYLTEEDTKDG